ncbi:54S ribosomal protein L24, mitochondrial [Fulvia fulva]|uniref:Large ribosomal subunit protein bL28m n=1 Tax=Passalora fulva TaxID=5499 RepID=A0A9Q8P353_PASFU|nr:54S ribosomal protein L24, mitochondrial [Fulvia fulva]KAK4635709.1 54S ribosomal protein L24, mitochondrial [Fulvia fulva]KAK4637843.1 54S ribosomal protein L24, mitochondrial [Fulvia fulva]UJO11640.1 54S ribosomal protein L24, mitochondrial [Fulvia fulva]WPV08755.1 54S ribosomal protein L24, mitochondrial [Fulvia fulva]WPV23554.1 54S ribosomal protein L24, mitochondrial [Fulvia fulva]
MAALFRRSSRQICHCQRSFSTSTPLAVSLQWDKNDAEALKEVLPPYPYGESRWYKQSNRGLYGDQRMQTGNNVSDKYEVKTRRQWHPNIFTRKLFSRALNRNVQVRVSARVLRTIDKLGGLDEYLLGEKEARIKELGVSGWWLRWAIMQTPSIKKRFAEERVRLGLPAQREDLEAVTEAIENSTPDEEAEFLEETESVIMDDAFQVDQDVATPIIKFRVGPGQHVMLTADGWRRTRPDPSYFITKRKERIASSAFPEYVEKRMEVFEKELEKRQQRAKVTGQGVITDEEVKMLIKSTRRQLRAELKEKVDTMYDEKIAAKERGKAERKLEKEQKKASSGLPELLEV